MRKLVAATRKRNAAWPLGFASSGTLVPVSTVMARS